MPETRSDWLKRQIRTLDADLREYRDGKYSAHSHPGRARRVRELLATHRRELAALAQMPLLKAEKED